MAGTRPISGIAGVDSIRHGPIAVTLAGRCLARIIEGQVAAVGDRHLWIGAQVVIPRRIFGATEIGGKEHESLAIYTADERRRAQLATFGARRRQQNHRQAGKQGRSRVSAAGQHQHTAIEMAQRFGQKPGGRRCGCQSLERALDRVGWLK